MNLRDSFHLQLKDLYSICVGLAIHTQPKDSIYHQLMIP